MVPVFVYVMNPGASAFPVACCGVSERLEQLITSLRIEESLQQAAGSFNPGASIPANWNPPAPGGGLRNSREVALFKSRQVGMPVGAPLRIAGAHDRASCCYDEETDQEAENEKNNNDRNDGFARFQ